MAAIFKLMMAAISIFLKKQTENMQDRMIDIVHKEFDKNWSKGSMANINISVWGVFANDDVV